MSLIKTLVTGTVNAVTYFPKEISAAMAERKAHEQWVQNNRLKASTLAERGLDYRGCEPGNCW